MIDLTNNNNFDFGIGLENKNSDFRILCSNISNNYDLLIFTDSKGTSIGDCANKEWTIQIINNFKLNKKTFLFISRPKEITTFFTLLNFLKLNKIKFQNLISNVGFVDFTPKKEEFIDDIITQNPFKNYKINKYVLCDYTLNSGETVKLYSINYLNLSKEISELLGKKFNKIFLIETFDFKSDIKIKRKRPLKFFTQLNEGNKFIKLICSQSNQFLFVNVNNKLPKNGNTFSYDAVHFTQNGHDKLAEICIKKIIL